MSDERVPPGLEPVDASERHRSEARDDGAGGSAHETNSTFGSKASLKYALSGLDCICGNPFPPPRPTLMDASLRRIVSRSRTASECFSVHSYGTPRIYESCPPAKDLARAPAFRDSDVRHHPRGRTETR